MAMNYLPTPEIVGHHAPARPGTRTGAEAPTKHRWLRIVRRWIGRQRERQALASLDDRLLADIGITRFEAAHEAAKPFWR